MDPQRPVRAVIVDGDETRREALAMRLRTGGIEVAGVAGGLASGREVVRRAGLDVAVVAVALPDGDGTDLAHELQDARCGASVVLCDEEADPERVYNGVAAGARGFVIMDEPDDAVTAVHAAARGDTYLPPRLHGDLAAAVRADLASPPKLTARERETLELLAAGYSTVDTRSLVTEWVTDLRNRALETIRRLRDRGRRGG